MAFADGCTFDIAFEIRGILTAVVPIKLGEGIIWKICMITL